MLVRSLICVLAVPAAVAIRAQAAGGDPPEPPRYRVDTSVIDSKPWRRAIERITASSVYQAGRGQATLLRVLLEGDDTNPTMNEPSEVNGVRVRVTGSARGATRGGSRDGEHADEDRRATSIQAMSTKLNSLDDFPGGGGMFASLESGDFLVIEHIGSASRSEGKDPVQIVSASHGRADLRVPVPRNGELGVFGDLILPRIARPALGRIIADVRSPDGERPRAERMEVGLVTVGGPYSHHHRMTSDRVATSRLLAPGEYPILLPTPETPGTPTNRWRIVVEPGSITYLTFFDPGMGEIELRDTQTIRPGRPEQDETPR